MRPLPLLLILLATPALADDPPPPDAPAAATQAALEPSQAPATTAPAATAPAAAAPAATAEAVATPTPPPPEAPLPRFGMRLGAGFPDGATLDLVYRPRPWIRLQAGPAWNYVAFGGQGGVALTPFRWAVSPVFEVRYGRFGGADLNKVIKDIPAEMQSLATDVTYDYVNGQLAFEMGSPSGFTFSLAFGLTYLRSDVHGTGTTDKNTGTPDAVTVTVTDPSLRAVFPSVRLGLLYYF
jgi:hypothetical protein